MPNAAWKSLFPGHDSSCNLCELNGQDFREREKCLRSFSCGIFHITEPTVMKSSIQNGRDSGRDMTFFLLGR